MPDHNYFAKLIWQIADLLRGPYRPPQYERVMLPMTVLRRFDCVLAPTKAKVLAEHERSKDKFKGEALDARLNKASGQRFHNHSPLDFENVPLKEDLDAYFEREVRPHVPDAWMDRSKDKVGYEINFNRHFYKYSPPRPLEEIDAELKQAEEEILRLLQEVTE
jgi:type I restriction-modification system DNA methylase subunit